MITKNINGNNISQDFIDQIRSDSPVVIAKLMLNGSELSCDIMRVQVTKGSCGSTELSIGNVISDMLTASVKELSTAIKGKDIECYIGAWTGADYEYISLGVFTVTEAKKTRYTTEITAYSNVVGKTATLFNANNSSPSIAELASDVATQMGVTITFDPTIDTAQIVMANVFGATLYQCLQAIAICSGGYIVNDNAGNILVKKFDATPTLSVDTGMMVNLPEIERDPVEIRSVKCNGEYPYSASMGFLVDENDNNIVDEQDRLFYGYDTAENADVVFNCDYMTDDVFNANIVDIIGYKYWYADVGLTLGDPRLEGTDVLEVTDVDGTVYSVPCHQIIHTYTGGFKSDIKSAQPTQQQNDIGSVSPLGASMEMAFQASTNVKKMGQYFWFVGDGNDAGAHITETPKDEFVSTPTGGNLLARSDGLIMRDGLTELSKFGAGQIVVGEEAGSHVAIDSNGMKLYSEDGSTVGATIESGSVVLGGISDEGGSLVVYDSNGNQVGQINSNGIQATKGLIGELDIDANGLSYDGSGYKLYFTKDHLNISYTNSNGLLSDAELAPSYLTLERKKNYDAIFWLEMGESSSYPRLKMSWDGDTSQDIILFKYPTSGEPYLIEATESFRVSSNFSVTGTKSRVIKTDNYSERLQYCYETPTPLFGDIGEAMLDESGICYVDIDDIFSETIAKTEYQVFLQKEGEGDCYVAEKTERYFVIKGTPNLKVAWELKAKQKDYELTRLEEPSDFEDYAIVNADIYDYIEEQENLLYG